MHFQGVCVWNKKESQFKKDFGHSQNLSYIESLLYLAYPMERTKFTFSSFLPVHFFTLKEFLAFSNVVCRQKSQTLGRMAALIIYEKGAHLITSSPFWYMLIQLLFLTFSLFKKELFQTKYHVCTY